MRLVTEPIEAKPTPAELRPIDDRPVHTDDLPDTPTRDRSIPASAWIEAPAELRSLADDLPAPTTGSTARYLRRIGPWLLWRAGPAKEIVEPRRKSRGSLICGARPTNFLVGH